MEEEYEIALGRRSIVQPRIQAAGQECGTQITRLRGKEVCQSLFQWPQYHSIRTWTLAAGKKKNGKDIMEENLQKSDNSRDWRTKERHLQTCYIDAHEMRIMVATVAKKQ